MDCSKCGRSMETGRVEVHATTGAFLVVGWSLQDLFWYDRGGKRKSRRRILESSMGRTAYGCKPCGLITIDATSEQTAAHRGKSWSDRFRPTRQAKRET